jgi:hypothetical protein
MNKTDLAALGFRLFVDPVTPLLELHQTAMLPGNRARRPGGAFRL